MGWRAALDALPGVVAQVGGPVPGLFDSGLHAVIENCAAELDLTIALCGQRDVSSMHPDLLQPAG